ncbi:MAG TPA: cysteine desulfurase [Candidatus Acidoferrales bacterium]|nr:cysteine desulfurase [Candidatus Acidoferrales bacterium]
MYDLCAIRKDFPILDQVVYLDNAATSQTPTPVVEAINEYFFRYAGNYGRGAHRLARETTERYEGAREMVADFFSCDAGNVIFTKNTTESINIVAHGRDWEPGDHIVTSMIEHHSNYLPWVSLRTRGVVLDVVESNQEGMVDPAKIERSITDRTKLITISHVSNVFGSIQDVKRIIKIGRKNDIPVLVDAAQSAGHICLSKNELGCDYLAVPGHKGLLGPQGTGILILRDPSELRPTTLGGGAVEWVRGCEYELLEPPARFEAGTPNIPGVIGLGRSVEYVAALGVANIEKHVVMLARAAAQGLGAIDNVTVYGPKDRAAVVPFNVGQVNPHDVSMILDETSRICTRSGYHCAMPALESLGINGTVRASFGVYNTEEEVSLLIDSVNLIAASMV